ncbi:hypothetical protein FB382_003731 [Nocardioides ginsengisegetis]|uniref:Uncharacterized protein n=1 Tax=Nocardioides ginsengisegetis TaxID=661491 RepID=A0A7W3PB45_9ACTN|nr:hypothetical protein [Nocardioides ginsengisegetis]MBA8805440.1 hypothetical protein [Nocardioides ginsengisegetis]
MSHWTDERVVARLTETFARHEHEADPEVARRIALATQPARRRPWPPVAAAAAAMVLVAGLATYAVHATGSNPEPSNRPPTVDRTSTANATNRDRALAEAVRVLETIPVPPGSTKVDSAPTRSLSHLRVIDGYVDLSLKQTNWWEVPLSYGDLVTWYDTHSPANTDSAFMGPGSTSPEPVGDLMWETHETSEAYSSPAVVVSYARLDDDTTAIRTDVTLAARYDRTAETLVPSTVTSVDITKSAIDGPSRAPVTATVTDPKLLARITSAFNDLNGAMAHTSPPACGSPSGLVFVYAVTFHWPRHTLEVDPGAALCGIGRGLSLDGSALPESLENDDTLDAALQAALGPS